jgi:outer membrane protein assembly factor BamD
VHRRALRSVAALIAAAALAGCAGDNERDTRSGAEQLYELAHRAMESSNYRNAIAYYELLEARFPFSNEAKQAQLDLIYSYYKNGQRESAIDAAMQFERENPTHPRVDYAIYMRGLAMFRGQSNVLHRLLRVDLARRPPDRARESFSAFAQLLRRFPDSPYAADARQRMIFLRNRLADYENHVARYYLERGAYMAAINRAQFVIETYDGAPAVAESLRIMIEAYGELGMADLAASASAVLATTFPDAAAGEAEPVREPWYKFW